MTGASSDPRLLAVARRVLEANRFRVREAELAVDGADDASWLLAESEYFVLGVVAGYTLDDLIVFEGYVADALGALVQDGDLGSKRWDSYVVLLASAGAEERGAPSVVGLQHNTRSLRRIVALGTAAHEEAVTHALANFLPLPQAPAGGLPSAFEELVAELVINGIAQEQAIAAVDSYRANRGIDGS